MVVSAGGVVDSGISSLTVVVGGGEVVVAEVVTVAVEVATDSTTVVISANISFTFSGEEVIFFGSGVSLGGSGSPISPGSPFERSIFVPLVSVLISNPTGSSCAT